MTFANKLVAIQTIRNVAGRAVEPTITKSLDSITIHQPTMVMGLREATDIVEACMVLGVRLFLEDPRAFLNAYTEK